jgi:hypothetical protein
LAALWAASRVEQRRAKVRPTTSDVSALSRIVANSHQAMPTFPLPPLKFRTVGFPQYGFKPVCRWRPSPVSPPAYTPLKGESDFRRCSLAIFQGVWSASRTHWPNGPWLLHGL